MSPELRALLLQWLPKSLVDNPSSYPPGYDGPLDERTPGFVRLSPRRPLGPRWYGCLPDEAQCQTCSRIRLKSDLETVIDLLGQPWVECRERDENGECK